MRKGLSIRIVGGVTLAIVGVSLLVGVFSTNFGGGAQGIFCSTYETVSVVFPGKDSPPPKGCGESRSIEYEVIKASSQERLSLELSQAILKCWKQYKGYNTSDEFCEGWNVKETPGPVGEADVTEDLRNNNLCPERIENSDAEFGSEICEPASGGENNIFFEISGIDEGDFITIEYNATASGEQRVVIG